MFMHVVLTSHGAEGIVCAWYLGAYNVSWCQLKVPIPHVANLRRVHAAGPTASEGLTIMTYMLQPGTKNHTAVPKTLTALVFSVLPAPLHISEGIWEALPVS